MSLNYTLANTLKLNSTMNKTERTDNTTAVITCHRCPNLKTRYDIKTLKAKHGKTICKSNFE